MGDPLVLALAADLDRVLVSHDEDSMPVHFYRFVASRESPGLILIRQRMATGIAIEELRLVWTRMDTGLLTHYRPRTKRQIAAGHQNSNRFLIASTLALSNPGTFFRSSAECNVPFSSR